MIFPPTPLILTYPPIEILSIIRDLHPHLILFIPILIMGIAIMRILSFPIIFIAHTVAILPKPVCCILIEFFAFKDRQFFLRLVLGDWPLF